MEQSKWKKCIIDACNEAGTYKPYFESVIDTLAQILETRDIAYQQWVDEGCQPVITNPTRDGESTRKNPLMNIINDLNAQALAYWRDIGLTPSGLKKINENAIKADEQKESQLEKLLREAIDEKKKL